MTEMISCHSITAKGAAGRNGDEYFGQNVGAQIFGADPGLIADAAKILEQRGAAWIDINMGCPVPKVATRAGAGAFLMRDHKLAGRIIEAVVRAVKIPVSIKTRLGWDEQHLDSANLLRIAAESGVGFATVHARTRAQGYSGQARWAEIPNSQFKMPIIFNGDIKTKADVEAVKKMGAGGAMVGRAFLGKPNLFNYELCIMNYELILEHFDLVLSYYGESGIPMFRKHAAWYAAGRAGAGDFRRRVNVITDAGEMKKVMEEFFAF
jgi:tRNA-dihydrouridine synthase B